MAEFQPPQNPSPGIPNAMGCANLKALLRRLTTPNSPGRGKLRVVGRLEIGWFDVVLMFFVTVVFEELLWNILQFYDVIWGFECFMCFFFCKEFLKSVLAVIRERGISFIPIMSMKKVSFLHSLLASQLYGSVVSNVFFNFHL